jgi:porin
VYREIDAKDNQGLTLFAGATFAPPDINTFPFFFMSGGVYHGPIPGRERDTVGFGIAYGKFSGDLDTAQRQKHHFHGAAVDGEDFEVLTELTYQFELTPHFIVQPGIYYIIQPKGMSEIANALVVGLQFALNL